VTKYLSSAFLCVILFACGNPDKESHAAINNSKDSLVNITAFDHQHKSIHVIVALCDNKYQGIVPVPKAIGNGQDPNSNLYWGNNYGVRAYFKNSKDWKLISKRKGNKIKLERLVFKHVTKDYYLVADAYDGQYIRNATRDMLYSCSGQMKDTIHTGGAVIGINGNSNLIAYVGHDGLMDFQLKELVSNADGKTRDCIILACISKKYFNFFIHQAKTNPLVWTNQLMCPEAYTLHDAIAGYVENESATAIRTRAVKAYSKYQNCKDKESRAILVSGW